MTVKSSRVSLYGCLDEQVRPSSSSLARHFLLRMPLAFGFSPLRVRLDVRKRAWQCGDIGNMHVVT